MTPTLRAVLVNDTAAKGHHGCALVNRQLAELAREAGIAIVRTLPLTASWETIQGEAPDLIVVNGEGTLHHDTKGAHAIAALGAKAHEAGVTAFLINSICQAVPSSLSGGLKGYAGVFARDRYSQQSFAEHGLTAGYAPDLTLTYRAPSRDRRGDTLFITDSSMSAETAALFRLSETLPGARFLPLRSRPPEERGALDREMLRYRLRRLAAKVHPDPVYRARYGDLIPRFDDFIAELQRDAGFLLAGRFHAVCIALDLQIPFFVIPTNSWKVEALLQEVGLSHRLLTNLDGFKVLAADKPPSAIAPFTEDEHSAIEAFKQMAQSENAAMFQAITASARAA